MKIYCPHCGQYYDLDESYLGKNVECAQCGKTFAINTDNNPMVCCPYCGGELQPGVKKCRHCGEWLINKKSKKHFFIFIGIIVVMVISLSLTVLFLRITGKNSVAKPMPSQQTVSSSTGTQIVKTSVPESSPKKVISPTIGVKHFANPAHSATCILYKNDREFMRKETTIGWVIFNRVECLPDDILYVEMQYKNGYGTVAKITKSYSRKASSGNGNVIDLEPEWEHDREVQSWENK